VHGSIDPEEELVQLGRSVARAAEEGKTLVELERWLREQPWIESLDTDDYVIETDPPQKEYRVRLRTSDGRAVRRAIDIILYPDGSLRLGGIHELA